MPLSEHRLIARLEGILGQPITENGNAEHEPLHPGVVAKRWYSQRQGPTATLRLPNLTTAHPEGARGASVSRPMLGSRIDSGGEAPARAIQGTFYLARGTERLTAFPIYMQKGKHTFIVEELHFEYMNVPSILRFVRKI